MKVRVLLLAALCVANSAAVAEETDNRTVIQLPTHQRAMVLSEMRAFLSGLQQITEALSREDMEAVANAARPLGSPMTRHMPADLGQSLPEGFRALGSSVHSDFDHIALDAESLGDPGHTLSQLGATLSKCVSCHETYQIRLQNAPDAGTAK